MSLSRSLNKATPPKSFFSVRLFRMHSRYTMCVRIRLQGLFGRSLTSGMKSALAMRVTYLAWGFSWKKSLSFWWVSLRPKPADCRATRLEYGTLFCSYHSASPATSCTSTFGESWMEIARIGPPPNETFIFIGSKISCSWSVKPSGWIDRLSMQPLEQENQRS